MTTSSIRFRATAALLLLVTMAGVETAIVLYVQRESRFALDEASRTQTILLNEVAMRSALRAMQAALRGFVITRDPDELAAFDGQWAAYESLARATDGLIRDPAQQARFADVIELARSWREAGRTVIAARQADGSYLDILARLAVPQFERLQPELTAFAERQQALSNAAADLTRARIGNATLILTVIPAVAVVFMFGLLAATRRGILHPLTALVESARRLARGEYDTPLPPGRRDEIGALIGAFSEMRAAVQARAAEAAEAQQRAHVAHAELLGVLDTAPAGLVVLDAGGLVLLQNRAAEHVVGVPPAGSDPKAFWHSFAVRDTSGRPLRIRDLPMARALSGSEVIGEELEVTRPDGRRFDVLVGAMPLRDERGRVTGAVAGFQDITRLRELDRLKDEFVAIVSHELRTPLTAIRGALQLLLAENAAASAEHRELLAVASNSCERLVRIVNDMLDVSKIEAGRLQLQLAPQSIETLVRQAVDGVRALAGSAGVEIAADVENGLPAVRADADRLTQALVNLLSNAIKVAPRGSAIAIRARGGGEGAVAVSVADRGPGIGAADLSRLFQKFQQLDSAGTRRTGGTGLGLVITKGIVEEHGGTIAVESVVGEGTTFTLTVPIWTDVRKGKSEPPALAGDRDSGPPILIVDDREATRASVAMAVRAAGLRPVLSAGGPAALEASRREQPAAILVSFSAAATAGSSAEAISYEAAARGIPLIVSFDDGDADGPTPAAIEARAAELAGQVKRLLDNRPHGTILVADDDPDARFVLRKVLERQGFRVVEAVDGADVLERTARDAFDLLVLDLRMPRLHGHDVIRTLRANPATATLPIIVLSGSSGERQSLHALVLGANAFLTKPAAPDVLVGEIRRLVHRERPT